VLATVFTAGWILVFARDHWDSLYDDTFIYLRYVKNLRAGCGLRFNCDGPAVEGFTAPLYLAVLWLGSFVTDQLIALCQVVGTICMIAMSGLSIAAAIWLGRTRRIGVALAIAVALVIALDPFEKLNAVIGMETAMAAMVFSLLLFAAILQRPKLLLVAVIAGVLLRPEGALFVVALPLLPWMRRRPYLIAAAAALVAITVVRFAIFGELVPNTYLAKSGGTARHLELGLSYIADAIVDFPLAFAAPLALLIASHRRAVGYVLVVTLGWIAFFLRSGGDTFAYSRLIFPLVPALSVLALAGLAELVARRSTLGGIAAVLACSVGVGTRAAIVHAIPPQHANERVVGWVATGLYLRKHFPHATVATVPIGAIGYYSNLPILDLVGLTEPAIAKEGRTVPEDLLTKMWIGHERNFVEYVLDRAPTVIVTTMERSTPWVELADTRAGFYADWLVLQEIKAGRAPYHVFDAEVTPGEHVLMFERDPGK
jgi:arabinofuranosyltransferase